LVDLVIGGMEGGPLKVKFSFKLAAPPPPEDTHQPTVPAEAPLSEEELARIAEKKRRKKERKERERAEAAAAAAAAASVGGTGRDAPTAGGLAPAAKPAGNVEDGSVSLGKRAREAGPAAAPRPRLDPVLRQAGAAVDAPKLSALDNCITKLCRRDKDGFFQTPVTDEVAPGYSAVVRSPMDLSTMRRKAKAGEYSSWDAVAADVDLIVQNCLQYNQADTIYAASARRFDAEARAVLQSYKPAAPKPIPAAPEAKPRMPAPGVQSTAKPTHPLQSSAAPARAAPRAPPPHSTNMPPSFADARGSLAAEENKRLTFKPRSSASRLPTLYGPLPLQGYTQPVAAYPNGPVIPVAYKPSQAPFAPDGYARSLSRFAVWLGPRGRAYAMDRAASAVDPLPAHMPVSMLPQWPKPQPVLQGLPMSK
jgi:hypothetical protein